MPITNCRLPERRKWIVENYNLGPLCHIKLLNGQNKQGAAGKLTDRYYAFEYAHKKIATDEGTFFCGYRCAEHFLELLNLDKLTLFNPLSGQTNFKSDETESDASAAPRTKDSQATQHRHSRHPLNQEVFNAINLLCIAWKEPPGTGLSPILEYIDSYPALPCYDWRVLKLNEIVGKDHSGRSLRMMINELRADNNTLKDYRFPLIEGVLARKGIRSFIDPASTPISN